jgi:hypothetical protein
MFKMFLGDPVRLPFFFLLFYSVGFKLAVKMTPLNADGVGRFRYVPIVFFELLA